MAKLIPLLTIKRIKEITTSKAIGRFPDGNGGLYLLTTHTGSTLWRYAYTFESVKHTYAIGKYPALSLDDARSVKRELDTLRAKGINPNAQKAQDKAQKKRERLDGNTFEEVTQKWLKKQVEKLSVMTIKKHKESFERDFYPTLGKKIMSDIKKREIIAVAEAIQERGALESGFRALSLANQVWQYALNLDIVEANIAKDIDAKSVLTPFQNSEFPTITDPLSIGKLLIDLDSYLEEFKGDFSTSQALKILPFLFGRSGNIRFMEWSEIDFEAQTWTIPATKLKQNQRKKLKEENSHIIPLCPQALKILKETFEVNGLAKYVFHSSISSKKPLSENTLSYAFKRMGYKDVIVPHGFRAMFSTIANESGLFRREAIDALLAHSARSSKGVSSSEMAYNRAKYEDEKRKIVEWYGEFLDKCKKGGA